MCNVWGKFWQKKETAKDSCGQGRGAITGESLRAEEVESSGEPDERGQAEARGRGKKVHLAFADHHIVVDR